MGKKKQIELPYGETTLQFSIDEQRVLWVAEEQENDVIDNIPAAVKRSLLEPIGAPVLKEIVAKASGSKTVVLIDDNTRSTPQSEILPTLLDELNAAGVPDENITLMVALGTHRAMKTDELRAHCGSQVFDRVKIINLPQGDGDFIDLGITERGTPIHVSRTYLESDISIAVGNIIPHMYAGWSGGAKMIQPGVTNSVTTGCTHLMASRNVYSILGEVDNPVRKEMDEIAIKTGLSFIVNTVMDSRGRVTAIVSGDPIKAHRVGVKLARINYEIRIPSRAEIVIAGSHPADRDLWQGFKPLNNSAMSVCEGGVLILAIPAPEGIAPDHHELVRLGTRRIEEVDRMLADNKISDLVAAATYTAYRMSADRISIILVSEGIPASEAEKIGLHWAPNVKAALEVAEKLIGRTDGKANTGIIPRAGDILLRIDD